MNNKSQVHLPQLSSELLDEEIPYSLHPVLQMLNFDTENLTHRTWHYPVIKDSERSYQQRIIESSLLKNTLICLPTGMGKTFIGLVVMYNFYRWFPNRKILFMAPTRPLVNQQFKAWNHQFSKQFNIKAVEVTGSMGPEKRHQSWTDNQIFFTTPQVLENDLVNSIIEKESIICLIMDEAHKAVGNYAYCSIVSKLQNSKIPFRLCALTATPGPTISSIQELISNLNIEKIEFLEESSEEIKKYTSERTRETILMPNDELIDSIKSALDDLIRKNYVFPLKKFGISLSQDIDSLNIASLTSNRHTGPVEGYLGGLRIILHVRDLLCFYGINSFISYIKSFETIQVTPLKSRIKNQLAGSEVFQRIFSELLMKTRSPDFLSHPKLKFLGEALQSHFNQYKIYDDTRAMIFSNYRESVHEICQYIQNLSPLLKPAPLLGQSDSNKRDKMNQQQTIDNFIQGNFNILVTTCIGEEGLDIGYVDLIIFYDAHSSPIRLVQRSGRTGRQRDGKIIILVNENKEKSLLEHSELSSKIISNAMCTSDKHFKFKIPDINPTNPFGHLIQMVKFNVNVPPKIDATTNKRSLSFKPHVLPGVPKLNSNNSCILNLSFHSIIGHSLLTEALIAVISQIPKHEDNRSKCQTIWKQGLKMMPIFKFYNYIPNSMNDYDLFYKFMQKDSSRAEAIVELPDSFFESEDLDFAEKIRDEYNLNDENDNNNLSTGLKDFNQIIDFEFDESELVQFDWSETGF